MVDHDYIKTLGLQLLAGRDFRKKIKLILTNPLLLMKQLLKIWIWNPGTSIGKNLALAYLGKT